MCDISTTHDNGFAHSETTMNWVFMCFKTPFFYKTAHQYGVGDIGDMILHQPGIYIEHGPLTNDECFINDWICFEADTDIINQLNLKVNEPVKCLNPKLIENFISSIMFEEIKNDSYSPCIISNNIHNMLLHYKRDCETTSSVNAYIKKNLEYVRSTVLSTPAKYRTLKDMAELSGYSVSRFCNLYSSHYGISPVKELIDVRIEKSKYLLKTGSYSVTEISEMCGFSSVHYFSKAFKLRNGISPSQYK